MFGCFQDCANQYLLFIAAAYIGVWIILALGNADQTRRLQRCRLTAMPTMANLIKASEQLGIQVVIAAGDAQPRLTTEEEVFSGEDAVIGFIEIQKSKFLNRHGAQTI